MEEAFEENPVAETSNQIEKLQGIELVGETIKLKDGRILQKPNPAIIEALTAIDPRIRYFPTDIPRALEAEPGYAYYRGVTDHLPAQIMRDFPGDIKRTAQRGTVASLRDEFPHYDIRPIDWEAELFNTSHQLEPEPINEEYLVPMYNVITILRTGSERGGELGDTGGINKEGELNTHTADYLMIHTSQAIRKLVAKNEHDKADNLFPVLLVYETNRIRTDESGNLVDPSALIAIYITDRIIDDTSVTIN